MAYDANKYAREYQGEQRAKGREQSPPPSIARPRTRKKCDASLYYYGLTCYPETFSLKPSPDHKTLADEIQKAIEFGTKRAIAVQRGFGKTSWCAVAVEWAALTGRAAMIMLVSGNQEEADALRDGIVVNLETNDALYALYPEIPHFFRETAMAGPQLKATFQGEPLRLTRRADIVFPAVPFTGSEACIRVRGIDSKGVRGAHHVRTDGTRARPTVVLLDDPQDDDLARSQTEVDKRVSKIKKTIHGLGPPGRKLTVLMPCTPIEKGDLAETFLDRSKTPEYQGIKWPALDAFPDCFEATENNLWVRYFEILAEDLADGLDEHPNATAYYVKNKKAMSKGARVRWEARVDGSCHDALQSLMNRYAEGRAAFMSEFQMEPEDLDASNVYLDEDEIATRYNRLKRRQVPDGEYVVTSAIDVQKRLLYWSTTAWSVADRKGYIVDFGTYPKQPRPQFTHLNAPNTMMKWAKRTFSSGLRWEEALQLCLRALVEELRGAPLIISGAEVHPGVILVDNRWNSSRQPVNEVALEPEFSDILQPAGGLYVGGGDTAISARKMPKGSKRPSTDVEWYVKRDQKQPPTVLFDANYYRSAFQQGLATESGRPGSITFFGRLANRVLAEHFAAKSMQLKEGTKRSIEEWKNKIGRDQDHWLDTSVMCRVGLELLGFRGTAAGRKKEGAETSQKLTKEKLDAAKRRAAASRKSR